MFDFSKKIQRLSKTKIRAVSDVDLIVALEKLKLLEKISKGEIKCIYTGEVITLENLHAVIPTDDGFKFVSENAVIRGLVSPE